MIKKTKIKPLFIVFEGIDGAGKSMQTGMLADRLRADKIPFILTAEPSDGPTGRLIKSLKVRLNPEEETRLFTEDRRHHVENVILPAIKNGKTVICDRYLYSSVAYQGARGVDPARILSENRQFVMPDLIFLLEITVEIALSRISCGRSQGFSAFEARSDLEVVRGIYRSISDPAIHRMNGTLPPDELHREIVRIVKSGYEEP
ncbi:MAG: dTMP kinase [Desulfomonilaceae bacterium]